MQSSPVLARAVRLPSADDRLDNVADLRPV
jgi:hypothetical protein